MPPLSPQQLVETVLPALQASLSAGAVIPAAMSSDANDRPNFDSNEPVSAYEPVVNIDSNNDNSGVNLDSNHQLGPI